MSMSMEMLELQEMRNVDCLKTSILRYISNTNRRFNHIENKIKEIEQRFD